jgi:hypothetical protein
MVVIAAGSTPSSPEGVARYTTIAPIAAPNTNVNTGKKRNIVLQFADDLL